MVLLGHMKPVRSAVLARIAIASGLLAMASTVHAVCVNGHPSVTAEYQQSRFVVVGRVIAEEPAAESSQFLEGTTYVVVVKEALKNNPPKAIRLFSENSSGRFPVQIGETYLLFVYEALGRRMVDNCGNSVLASSTSSALSAVRSLR